MVFVVCSVVNCVIGLLQLVLVSRANLRFGIPDLFFALGDDGVQEFLVGIQFLPTCIMYMGMCPEGAEGTAYAMLTTFANLAGTVAFDLSTMLTKVWDVSQDSLRSGDFDGVFKVRQGATECRSMSCCFVRLTQKTRLFPQLSLLCTLAAPIPLVLINLIPPNRDAQDDMLSEAKTTWVCGAIFVGTLVFTMLLTFVESIIEVREGTGSEYAVYEAE